MHPTLHKDKDGFQAALEFTSRNTGFRIELIEKDYYCTLVLGYIFKSGHPTLVFKGGTSLNKVHLGFYRLSEDLDFTIPLPPNSARDQRSVAVKPFKELLNNLPRDLPEFKIKRELSGSNQSKQYNSELEYSSVSTSENSTIKVEVGLRELVLTSPLEVEAQTLLSDPFSGQKVVPGTKVRCLSLNEAYAEKIRAALTRREPAIRDWFDLDHAIQLSKVDFESDELLKLVRKKMSISENAKMGVSERNSKLRDQLETELRPVLREQDYSNFDLHRAIEAVDKISAKI